jgi:hypothetical protein
MTAAKEFVNIETGLPNYVTELIDVRLIASVWRARPQRLFDQGASIISLVHPF